MIFETGEMLLTSVREIFVGKVNDVLVCQDIASPLRPFYVVVAVHDSTCAKNLLLAMNHGEKSDSVDSEACLAVFAQNQYLCLLFPYRTERRLDAFAQGQLIQTKDREKMAVNLVMECLSTQLPYPLLYLALTQRHINLLGDGKIYFSPYFDLSPLDPSVSESDCANICTSLLLEHLELEGQKKLKSFALLRKKIDRSAYQSFPELYRDIRLTMISEKKTGIIARIKRFWRNNKERLFKMLVVLMGILIVLALAMLVSQLIFGDFILFSLFENKFRKIGTESLF